MTLRVSGKNLNLGEALRTRVSGRIEEAVQKYFDGGWSGHVTVAPEGPGYRAECVLHLDSGIVLQAAGEAQDAYLSCDNLADRVEKRLRRYKRRLKDKRFLREQPDMEEPPLQATSYVLAAPDEDAETNEAWDEAWNPVVIAETTASLARMSVRDAVLELDFTGAQALPFRHAGTGRMNVVYRRADGHIGWIDPPVLSEDDTH